MNGEKRSGEICNACVLLVKRFTRLPSNTTKHWNHVVDARSGPGLKSLVRTKGGKICKPKDLVEENECGPVTPEKFKKKHVYKKRHAADRTAHPVKRKVLLQMELFSSRPSWRKQPKENIRRIDLEVDPPVGLLEGILEDNWTEEVGCCGTVFRGPHGELGVDVRYVYPCAKHRRACEESADEASAAAAAASQQRSNLKLKLTATELTSSTAVGGGGEASSGSSDAGCDEGFFDKAAGSPSSVYTGASTPPYVPAAQTGAVASQSTC